MHKLLALVISGMVFIPCHIARAAELDAVLSDLEANIRSGGFPNLHSVILEKSGTRLAEWYFSGTDEKRGDQIGNVRFNAETVHDVRSVTKSVVSILFGIARGEGLIGNLDVPVIDFFPEYADLRTPEIDKITLQHVLFMASGLKWDERTYPYTDPRNSETSMDQARDKVRHIFSQPVVAPPGEVFSYSGGDVALIAEVISRATKMPLERYAETKLFEPLGIRKYEWLKDATGKPIAASGLRLLPLDMIKIGEVMRDGGQFRKKRIVPAAWVATVTGAVSDKPCEMRDRYFWWSMSACPARNHPAWYAAMGNGGQHIVVVPSANVVLVTTTGNYNSAAGDKVADDVLLKVFSGLR